MSTKTVVIIAALCIVAVTAAFTLGMSHRETQEHCVAVSGGWCPPTDDMYGDLIRWQTLGDKISEHTRSAEGRKEQEQVDLYQGLTDRINGEFKGLVPATVMWDAKARRFVPKPAAPPATAPPITAPAPAPTATPPVK
jgi:hypothetical protein